MSINVSQVFVRYPDEKDAAGVLAAYRQKKGGPSFIVVRTPAPWLAVSAGDDAPAPEAARALSRALEAAAVWYGLAGSSLAYRLIRFELGREAERVLEPPEIYDPDGAFPLPAYRDAEEELYRRLRALGLPAEYIYLFAEEIGMSGDGEVKADAVVVRDSGARPFLHRVPRRGSDRARTLFDLYKEGEQTVYETLNLCGAFDEARAQALFRTLEEVCRRRALPAGWKIRYLAGSARDPELGPRLADAWPKGKYSFDFAAAVPGSR